MLEVAAYKTAQNCLYLRARICPDITVLSVWKMPIKHGKKSTFKKTIIRRGLKDTIDAVILHDLEMEWLQKLSDPDFSVEDLRDHTAFWYQISQKNEFLIGVVVALVNTSCSEKIKEFFFVIFKKIKKKEFLHKNLQKLYNKFLEIVVSENQTDLLEQILDISFKPFEHEDFNPKTENSPALVKACMDNNLEITKILVDNGFILRLVGKNQSSI